MLWFFCSGEWIFQDFRVDFLEREFDWDMRETFGEIREK
jgi:hypothetical protein